MAVAARALGTLTMSNGLFALNLIKDVVEDYRNTRGLDAEFRMVAIPADAPYPETDAMFDKKYMWLLEELGRNMGTDPSVWTNEVPSAYSFRLD